MADQLRQRTGAIQDTGNPVLDTTANLIMNWPCDMSFAGDAIVELYGIVAQLYEKEPRRANPPERKSMAQMKREADQEVGAR